MSKNTSLTNLTPDATLDEIISVDRQAGQLLEAIGLNLSEHKDQSLRSICQQRKWSEREVLRWLKKHQSAENGEADKTDFDGTIAEWTEYLKTEYLDKNEERIEAIKNDFPRVRQIHGNQYPWLKNMQWQFERMEEALKMYYRFERQKFYPLLSKMEASSTDMLYGSTKKVERSIGIVQKDQDRIQEFMQKLRIDSNRFENPGGACSTLRILNQNFKTLFEAISKQFEIEQEQLLPAARKKIETVYL